MCSEAFKELWHPASVPYFHLLRLEKFRWPSSLENNNIFQSQKKWLYPITVLPPVLHPCPIYLSAWRVIRVKEARKCESGQRGRQRCCERARDSCGYVRFKKKKITCDKDEEKRDASGLGKSERLLLPTSSWPDLGTTVWVKPSVTGCFANCLWLMTLNLLASSLRVHQEVPLGQHDVFKASRSDN